MKASDGSAGCFGPGLRRVALFVACGLVLAQAAMAVPKVPKPRRGEWAQTTLALLRYNRQLCDDIAGRLGHHWRSIGGSPEAQESRVRDYVLDHALSDLAAARAAADIIRGFLPRAQAEQDAETAASLERLFDLETNLCDTVALPTAPRDGFELQVTDLLERIDREDAELGRLLVISDEVMVAAIEPYLVPIQLAGVEAEGEYLDYLESIRPKPEPPTLQELMVAWHGRYVHSVMPVKQALGAYLEGRQKSDSSLIRDACRQLSSAVIPVLRRQQEIFNAPDPAVKAPLENAFSEMRQLASQCSAARFGEVDKHFAAMQRYLGVAARILAKYSLRP